MVLHLMYKGGPQRMEDYRLVVGKCKQRARPSRDVTPSAAVDVTSPPVTESPRGAAGGMYSQLVRKSRGGRRGGGRGEFLDDEQL